MMNGDTFPDQLTFSQCTKSAGSASSSPASPSPHLTSCGESDHDRYCSANSVFGTPSIASSSIAAFNDCVAGSEFGSFRSSGLQDEFESFSLDGNQKALSLGRIGVCKRRIREQDIMVLNKGVELRDEDGDSSRSEHSEGEDSMYNYETYDDSRNNVYYTRKHGETVEVEDNSFLVHSSVAFGSNDWYDFEQEAGTGSQPLSLGAPIFRLSNVPSFSVPKEMEMVEDVKGIPRLGCQDKVADNIAGDTMGSRFSRIRFQRSSVVGEDGEETVVSRTQFEGADDDLRYLENCSVTDVFAADQRLVEEKPITEVGMNVVDTGMSQQHQHLNPEAVIGVDEIRSLEGGHYGQELGSLGHQSNSFELVSGSTSESFINNMSSLLSDNRSETVQSSRGVFEEQLIPVKLDHFEYFHNDVVHEMEEILLDSGESAGAMSHKGNGIYQPQSFQPLRDGGLTASTSDADDNHPLSLHAMRVESVEVVGAKQKKGDVSFSERLVGVKEYTVYVIRVWCGEKQWEVERRYRDFCTLYRRLKSFFSEQGWILPPPWLSVEKESRKMFGIASPDVIAERSVLIQECLSSVLPSGFSFNPPSPLIWFLSPQESFPSVPSSKLVSHSILFSGVANSENISDLGKTISLIVKLWPVKTMKQLLELQHYTCAACHKHFDEGSTLVRDFVKTFGWGKPRLCNYTGQLFCSYCHVNETAVLPARVLHQWDFTRFPVSQLAKSFLDSIHDQPMLCVSAVNPILYTKVPTLQHVMVVRKKIGRMLPFVRCPFRMSVNKGLGSRRYLLEGNDFFALRDLIDLSKGAFAALPVLVEAISKRIEEHIAVQCLICCDVGVPCSSRQACNDPSSLIFPFQEGESEKCASCRQLFHKSCFQKLASCHCGTIFRKDHGASPASSTENEPAAVLTFLGRRRSGTEYSASFLSGLFSKTKPECIKEQKNSDSIASMSSLGSSM